MLQGDWEVIWRKKNFGQDGEACEKEIKDPAKVSNLVNYYEYVTNRWVEYF